MAVSVISGSNTTLVHVTADAQLLLGRVLSSNAFVYSRSELVLAMDADVTITEWTYIKGTLTFTDLVAVTVTGNMTIQSQNFTVKELTIGNQGVMNVIGSDVTVFPLEFLSDPATFTCNGKFTAENVDLIAIDTFNVGPAGTVTFTPTSSDEYLGRVINIGGTVTLGRHVSIVHPCQLFQINGGSLSWTGLQNITMECLRVNINGHFVPGTVTFGEGAVLFEVGPLGVFKLTVDGPFLSNSIQVSGLMEIYNKAEFMSGNRTDKRVEVFWVSDSGQLGRFKYFTFYPICSAGTG